MVFITAEIGTSWLGDIKVLENMAQRCKYAGIDAVKLQAFKKEHLSDRYWRLISSVTEFNVDHINKMMQEIDIEWYCTPCYTGAVNFLEDKIHKWKIRYKDQYNLELIDAVLRQNETTFISVVDNLINKNKNIKSLYCIPKYPHLIHEVDWTRMKTFDGWSCHVASFRALESAVHLGMEYLEIHITPDKWNPRVVDNPLAFGLNDLSYIVDKLKAIKIDR